MKLLDQDSFDYPDGPAPNDGRYFGNSTSENVSKNNKKIDEKQKLLMKNILKSTNDNMEKDYSSSETEDDEEPEINKTKIILKRKKRKPTRNTETIQ